jgi:hypothetical protein
MNAARSSESPPEICAAKSGGWSTGKCADRNTTAIGGVILTPIALVGAGHLGGHSGKDDAVKAAAAEVEERLVRIEGDLSAAAVG